MWPEENSTLVRARSAVEMYARSLTGVQRRSFLDKRGKLWCQGLARLKDNYRALPEDQRRGFEEKAKETVAMRNIFYKQLALVFARNRMMRNRMMRNEKQKHGSVNSGIEKYFKTKAKAFPPALELVYPIFLQL